MNVQYIKRININKEILLMFVTINNSSIKYLKRATKYKINVIVASSINI
jgi:hypothetical protein